MDTSLLPVSLSGARIQSVQSVLEKTANPDITAVRLARVFGHEELQNWIDTVLFEGEDPTPLFESLALTLSQSEFLTSILEREPGLLVSFESDRDFSFSSSASIFQNQLHRHLQDLKPSEPFKIALTRFKLHEVFRIAVRDITNRAPIEVLCRELSDLADLVLQAAYEKVYADTLMTHGTPRHPDGSFVEMAILSLGKHGSHELNFSSDLDLILITPGEGKTDLENRLEACETWRETHPYARYSTNHEPTARMRSVNFETFFAELGTRLIDLVSDPGHMGLLYRIDMRLRPEGVTGPLVRTFESALQYYQNWGQRWERQALIRARPSAGCLELGAALLKELEGFIYRKYVDPLEVDETLREMRDLRFRSILMAGNDPKARRRNVKNGPGGIRDVEFLVQAVQNLYGAQFPELRQGTLFEVLRRIHQSGLMGEQEYTLLLKGYAFLRRLEHRVQMDDMQKYHLPPPGPNLEILARGMGYPDAADLESHYTQTTEAVHNIFRIVFRTEENEESVSKLLEQTELTPSWREILAGYGFREPEILFKSLFKLAEDKEAPHLNSKLRRLLKGILPRLLAGMREAPSPDAAWKTFERLSLATPARSTLFSLCEENPQFIRAITTIGSASPSMADQLVINLHRVEEILEQATFEPSLPGTNLEQYFQEQYSQEKSGTAVLAKLRNFQTRCELHTAGRFIMGLADVTRSVHDLSLLANFCLEKCIMNTGFGSAPEMVLLALGKFGGMELGFGSDLDLLILYDDRQQADSEAAQKTASELVVEMSRSTADGKLFEIDMRLRPHGKSSPLVPTIEGALDYYHREGQTWEKLAMTRMRPVWGDPALVQRFKSGLEEWIFDDEQIEGILREIREMRARIEKEKAEQALKCGPGGLIDIEFLAQAAQIVWGKKNPDIRSQGTSDCLGRLQAHGILDACEFDTLCQSHAFLREIENRLSLLIRSAAKAIPKDPILLEHLTRCMNTARTQASHHTAPLFSPESLVRKEEETRSLVREIFESVFVRKFEKKN